MFDELRDVLRLLRAVQVRVLVLDMLENSFRNYRVGYAASEAVVLLAIVLLLTFVQFSLLRDKRAAR